MNLHYQPELPRSPRPIVILGAGGIVNDAHLPAYRMAGLPVASIYNRTLDRAQKLADKFGIPQVHESVAAAVAAAPKDAVFDLALMPAQFIPTLEQLPDGSPVLIQKPMGDSLPEAQAILAVCRRKKLVAAINCQLRFAPFVIAARHLVTSGAIGELYDMEVRVTVHTPWDLFPNVKLHPRLEIAQHSVHYIDLIRSFLGNPRSVLAKTLRHPAKPMSSTRTTLIMDYDDTTHAVINTNHDHEFGGEHQDSFIKWEGTKGAIYAKMGLLMDYPHGVSDVFQYCLREGNAAPAWRTEAIPGSWFPEAFVGSMASLQRFANGETDILPTHVDDVVNTMAVVEAAYASSACGGVRPAFATPISPQQPKPYHTS
ncbi:MAG: Gfo/Idh/MocA family oxidoreductase [Lacunisphaera sp.]|nr:Gfo/Idh/MocA family oxidoreductase [Lacunisphaera sp.]